MQRASTQIPAPIAYYATYDAPDGSWVQGTAQHVAGRGWLFVADDGGDLFYASQDALVLGGRCDIADAKRAEEDAAGGLATLVCGYGKRV